MSSSEEDTKQQQPNDITVTVASNKKQSEPQRMASLELVEPVMTEHERVVEEQERSIFSLCFLSGDRIFDLCCFEQS